MITIGSDDAFVESYHEEGSENPLGYDRPENGNNLDYTIGTIPDIFFSSGFLRAWCEHLGNHHFRMHKEVMHVVEDMPEEHRALLAKATEAYLEENKEALMEIKDIEQSVICESCDRYINEAYGKLTEGEKLRLGLDLHGVIDDDKKYFSNLSKKILNRGGEVHVITGSKDTKELREKIAGLGIAYSHIFSISSHHEKKGTKVWEDDRGPWMDVEVWNRSKADYCREKRIHIHIDDSPIYGRYFDPQTIYIKYPEMEVINEARKI